ncbi:DUF4236 domain-containing protein [Ideonella sp. 4Y11]|uniref:DUF4236 domain-containing protein n=1 Tax=Ideonella aquatica TaxID=2824119 RepID=A0A940YW46_9BURK|nr:DUF4236 domain-containing protein [Ideonella aquatica]MBQ0960340.1 DUF4236 domain-containing protein [Ideonella aquatica]
MWRFRKSFSPLPGVRLTLSPSGISTSVGLGPLRVTSGPRGQHLTANIPGAGLSYRHPLTGQRVDPRPTPERLTEPFQLSPPSAPTRELTMEQIESAGSAVLTTPGIAEFRRLLDQARIEHAEIARALDHAIKLECAATAKYRAWRNGWLLRRILKKRYEELALTSTEARDRKTELEEQEELARLSTQIDVPISLKSTFSRFSDTFAQLARSTRLWDTVSHRSINQFAERTLAARAVERKSVKFALGRCEVIRSDWLVPHLENANGGDIYLYPLFVVYFAGEQNFALLEYKDLNVSFGVTRFHEEEEVPTDSEIVGRTWARTNKDGSPDRRFKENYEIPVVQYARLTLQSATGLNEEYMLSNVQAVEAFAKEWKSLVECITRGA